MDHLYELRPATKYMDVGIDAQLDKIGEEFQEVLDAFADGEPIERKAEELVDIQQSCETALAMLGLSDDERRMMRRAVIEKNDLRGYYDA